MTRLCYPSGPLHDVMRTTAARFPDKTAITFKGRSLTFATFDLESNRLANALRSLGVAAGDRVGLYLPNCPEYELGFYASSKLGAVACPMNPSYREREVTYHVNDSGATVLLTHASLWPVVDACRVHIPNLRRAIVVGDGVNDRNGIAMPYDDVMQSSSTDDPDVRVDQSQLAALPYSSGTTGLPKGVMLTQRILVCNQRQYIEASRIGPDDVYPIFLPLSHIYGVMLMNVALAIGAHQILMERFDLAALVGTIQRHNVTVLHLVPPVVLALANAPDLDASQFRNVRYALSAAAPLAPDIARRVQQRLGFPVVQAYGLTETGPASHHSPLEPQRIKVESVGTVMADTEQRVVDLETGAQVLAAGEVGEILIRGPQVMQGYWNAPDETARALRNGWLRTGDIGYVDEDGYTYLVDRKKEMIKCRAFSVAPAELEAALLEHPDILDCGVVGAPDEQAGEVPNAFVVVRKGCTLDEAALNEYFSRRLAGYKMIRTWHLIDAIPRTPSGKILRRVLKERLTS
jgi:long-chain acyl-CoA synthetase